MALLKHAIKIIAVLIIALGLTNMAKATDIAPYDIIHQDGKFDVRHYERMVWVSAPMDEAGETSSAFRSLFNYIYGDNNQEQKIAMTAPVFMDKDTGVASEKEQKLMSFVMPFDYSLASTPIPDNADLTIEEVFDYRVASIRFSGRLTAKSIKSHREKLEQWMLDNNFKASGDAKVAGYNAPYVLPFLRRNEVLIPVSEKH